MQIAIVLVFIGILAWVLVPRFVANYLDYRARLVVAVAYEKTHPKEPHEADEQYDVRVLWHVLTTFGIPPLFVVKNWMKAGKTAFIPPGYMLEKYLAEWEARPLADGKPDDRITNGQGERLRVFMQGVEALWPKEVIERGRQWLSEL